MNYWIVIPGPEDVIFACSTGKHRQNTKQAGAELGQAQPELGLEDRVFMLWFEL